MKASSMNTNTATAIVALPPALILTGLQKLTQARSAAMGSIAGELQAILPAAIAASASNATPEGLPDWAASAFADTGINEGVICWQTARVALARRTADLITSTPLGEQVTGGSLAGFLGLDLFSFAYEGWAEIEPVGAAMAGESK